MTSKNKENVKLFHVQDGDRPLYVLARNWMEALQMWKSIIARENNESVDVVEEPLGVSLIADESEVFCADDLKFLIESPPKIEIPTSPQDYGKRCRFRNDPEGPWTVKKFCGVSENRKYKFVDMQGNFWREAELMENT